MDARAHSELREKPQKIRERRGAAVGEARTARLFQAARAWAPLIGWMLAPGVFLALIGPFGSFAAPLARRFAYWLPTMAIGAVLGLSTARIMAAWSPRLAARPIAFASVHTVVVTALMVFVVWGWGRVVFGPGAVTLTPELFFYVGVITALISFMRIAQNGVARTADPAPPAEPAQPAAPTLARRLKPELRNAAILALEAEDHYVRVHTSLGSELLLMRLSDAIDETAGIDGFRAHRSWWVASAAVVKARRESGRTILTLADGAEAPVSRSAAGEAARFLAAKV
ncbi:MAG: LytTR family transcriptional regulator [Parvularculaceae bacterium]|nr:LytTR family transcriptional regulator [Parvularculaceae bacterium]